jgi:hypothetical protein
LQLEKKEDTGLKNTKVTLFKNAKLVLLDSIFSSPLLIAFRDMNTDGTKDILVFQSSGARANDTYNLYLLRKKDNAYIRVKGFEDWPNLQTTKVRNILVSMALTGTVHYHFLRLSDTGELIDLGIEEQDKELDGKGYFRGLTRVKSSCRRNDLR